MIQNDLFTSCDTSEIDDIVYDDDPLSNDSVDTSITFDIELYNFVELDD